MKWDEIKATWTYREPKFWSECNLIHRFNIEGWKDGLYVPDDKNTLCQICHTWWARWYHNRHDQMAPPYFNEDGSINTVFYLKNVPDGFLYLNPKYTDDGRWLNGIGVALKREMYPDE